MPTLARAPASWMAVLLRIGERCSGPRVAGPLVLLLAAGYLVRRGIDDALSAMHLPGTVAAGASGVAGVETMLDPGRVRSAFESWAAWSAGPASDRYLSPASLLAGYALVDVLLVGLPLTLLLLAGLRSARQRALDRSYPLRDATVTATSYAVLPAAVFLLASVVENGGLLLAASGGAATWQLLLLGAAALVALLALVLAVLPVVLAHLATGTAGSMTAADLAHRSHLAVFAPVIILRAQVLTVALVGVLFLLLQGDLGRQLQDVLLGLPERPSHQALAVAAALLFAGLTYATGRWCVIAYEQPPGAPPPGARLTARVLWLCGLAGAGLIAAGVLLLVLRDQSAGWALLPPGGLLLIFALLSAFPGVRSAWAGTPGVPSSPATAAWLRTLVAVPLAASGLVALQGVVTLGVAREVGHAANLLSLAVLFVALAAVPLLWRGRWARAGSAARRAGTVVSVVVSVVGVVAVVGVGVWGARDPWTAGERLGSLAIVFAAFALLLVFSSLLVWAGDRWAARGALAFVRLRRVPLVSVVIFCFVATSYLDTSWRYHDVRLLEGDVESHGRAVSVAAAFDAWVATHRPAGAVEEKARVPMLFVATGGGGIRAYYWTTTVLDCLFVPGGGCEATLPAGSAGHMFAASGISGGSVGLAAFRATGDGQRSARTVLHDLDFVAPVLAALAFRDAPNAFLHADLDWLDRAGVLEVAWERSAEAQGFSLADGFGQTSFTPAGAPRFPLLLLNGAAEDGCRVTVSVLDAVPADPGRDGDPPAPARSCDSLEAFTDPAAPVPVLARTRDAFDFTCRDGGTVASDLRLSSAALLSARFPYVSPSGGLRSCTDPDRRTFVLDGGIIESSGAGPLVELWTSVAPLVRQVNQDPDSGVCVDPRLILIDNTYADTRLEGLPRRPPELLAPLRANTAAAGRAAAAARQAAAIAFRATFGETRSCRQPDGTTSVPDPGADPGPVAQLYPRSHPGPLAPLGWSLSRWAQADLRDQLRENAGELDRVRSWLVPQPSPGGSA